MPAHGATHIITRLIIWLAPRAGKMNQIARCDWLPERARPSCPLGTTRCIPQAKFPLKPYNKSFIDQVCSVKMAGYWPRSFLRVYGPRLRLGPKRTWPISSLLTSHLVNNPYIFAMFSVRACTRAYSSTFQDLDFDVSLSPLFIN